MTAFGWLQFCMVMLDPDFGPVTGQTKNRSWHVLLIWMKGGDRNNLVCKRNRRFHYFENSLTLPLKAWLENRIQPAAPFNEAANLKTLITWVTHLL